MSRTDLTHREIRETIKELFHAVETLWPTREDRANIPDPIAHSLRTIKQWDEKFQSGKDLTRSDVASAWVLCQAIHASLDTQLELRIQQETLRNSDALN